MEVSSKDLIDMVRAFEAMHLVTHHPYLAQERGIPGAVLDAPRFAGKVRMDARRNSVFPACSNST